MEIYRVQESDLIGGLEGFPIEVVQKMVERQHEQTGKCDVSVFQLYPVNGKTYEGFDWACTIEGYYFWCYVIANKTFKHFFARYPKQVHEQEESGCWVKPEGVRMLVWDGNEEGAVERIVIAKLPKNTALPYITVSAAYEEQFKKGEVYCTNPYKYAKPIPQTREITIQEIADKFNLKVNEFKIV